ncbi:EpsG family protein [Paenibacillus phytohabitans]|nr:EpsG family protein [Paenibacillus phytohabitans]
MVYALYFSCLLMNFYFAFRIRNSKFVILTTLVFIILVLGWNTGTLDNVNYIRHYTNISVGVYSSNKYEFMFVWLMELGNKLGLDWFMFKLLIACACVPLVYNTINLFTKNLSFVYFFYLLHAFFMDAEQFRNFIALSIFIFSIRFLLKKNKKSKFLYLMCVLLAASIHSSFILFLPLVILEGVNKNKFVKSIAALSLILCILTFFNGNRIPVIDNFMENLVLDSNNIERYLNSSTRFGFVIPFLLHILNFMTIYMAKKYKDRFQIGNTRQNEYINLIFWTNVFMFVFFPLFMKSITFYRLTRDLSILNFIALSIVYDWLKKNNERKSIFNFVIFLNVFIWFTYDLLIRADEILIPIFRDNLYLK